MQFQNPLKPNFLTLAQHPPRESNKLNNPILRVHSQIKAASLLGTIMTRSEGWQLLQWSVLWAALASTGCPRAAPPPAPTPISQATVPPIAPAAPPATAQVEINNTTQDDSHASTPEPEPRPPATESVPTTTSPPLQPESKERILLLATDRPLFIDFVLTIDGAPHTAALTKLVEEVLQLADTDGDGRTMWKELCACERIKYGQFGNLPVNDDNSEKQIIDRYDIARDGVVDRTELPRFLTRNAGGSRPFSIRGTLNNRGSNRRSSPTWRIIDADDSGVIDKDEMQAAAVRLAAFDSDDDEIVTAVELSPTRQAAEPEMMMADRRRRGPDAARLLGPHADWANVQRVLEQEYGGGRALRSNSSPFSATVFQQLDSSRDGRLAKGEYERLNDVAADLVVEVAFRGLAESTDASQEPKAEDTESARAPQQRRQQPQLKVRHVSSELTSPSPQIAEQPGRVVIAVGANLLTFGTNDTVAQTNFTAQAKQTLAMFDQNKDGYLEASEITPGLPGQLGRLEAVDSNGDGKAYPNEIEAYLAQQQAGLRAQIHARASDVEDLLFIALDTNHDQRLDSREVQQALARLAALDADKNDSLSGDELPEAFSLVLARGSIENADALFSPPITLANLNEKAPRWFRSMDANQDGAISRREFLGSDPQFAALDKNHSGLIERDEAEPQN